VRGESEIDARADARREGAYSLQDASYVRLKRTVIAQRMLDESCFDITIRIRMMAVAGDVISPFF
jgi:hypothetical protein